MGRCGGRTSLSRAVLAWARSATQPAVGQGKDLGTPGLPQADMSSEILCVISPPAGPSGHSANGYRSLCWRAPFIPDLGWSVGVILQAESCCEARLSKGGGLIWEKAYRWKRQGFLEGSYKVTGWTRIHSHRDYWPHFADGEIETQQGCDALFQPPPFLRNPGVLTLTPR